MVDGGIVCLRQKGGDPRLQFLRRTGSGEGGVKGRLRAVPTDGLTKKTAQRHIHRVGGLGRRQQVLVAPFADVGDVVAHLVGHGVELAAGEVQQAPEQRAILRHIVSLPMVTIGVSIP